MDAVANKRQLVVEADVGRRGTYLDQILARQDVPLACAALATVEAQLVGIETDADGLALTGLQRDAGKALQFQG